MEDRGSSSSVVMIFYLGIKYMCIISQELWGNDSPRSLSYARNMIEQS